MDQLHNHEIKGSTESYKYRRRGGLIMRKLAEYVPVMILTNISLFLINTVDQVVAGNYIGKEALSSISIFYPVTLIIAVFSGPVASGIATSISNALGKKDLAAIAHVKSAGIQIMITIAIAISIIQIPLVLLIISSYGLSDSISEMVHQYAIGIMISTPLGIISTVGTYALQIAGKMKVLMTLSIVEGLSNVAFDLLYVCVLDMGVAGAGFGTATANFIRCVLTIIYLVKYTDYLKSDGKRATLSDFRNILSLGLPDAAFLLMMAFQNYFTLRIILHAFGEDGGAIYGLCAFCLSIVNVLLFGIQGGMRPLMGLYVGGEDRRGIRDLVYHGFLYVLIGGGIISVAIIVFPSFFYHLNGVRDIPDGGELAVQLYAIAFIMRGCNHNFRLYFSNVKDIRFATTLTVLGCGTLPFFALMISMTSAPAPFIFLAYSITELIIFILSALRYFHLKKKMERDDSDDIVLYMTVKKDDAVEVSQYIRKYCEEQEIDYKVAFKTALCMEEMVAYLQNADLLSSVHKMDIDQEKVKDILKSYDLFGLHSSLIARLEETAADREDPGQHHLLPHDRISVDVIIRFKGKDNAILITLDDGAFIDLDNDDSMQDLITDNYGLIKKMATDVDYQYILNMNYTKITIGPAQST